MENMKQFFAPYTEWEDYQNGMWRDLKPDEEQEMLEKAIEFTGNANLYGEWMLKVIELWPVCTKVNLTNNGLNQKAWIGHAACCMAIGCPEHITRSAWWKLTPEQRTKANEVAKIAIEKWQKENYN